MPLVNPRILHDNFWRSGTIYASSDEDPAHPVTDTQVDTLEQYWRHQDRVNGQVTMYASNNLGSAKLVNSLALLSHNFDSSVVIKLFGADDSAITVNVVQRNISFYAGSILAFFDAFTKQYIKIEAVNATNPADYLKVSTIWAGNHLELNRRYQPEHEEGEEDFSESKHSDSQVLFGQEKPTLNVRRYSFQALNSASKIGIQALLEGCKKVNAFIFCIDYNAPNANILWVKNEELNPLIYRNGVWAWDMAIKEYK